MDEKPIQDLSENVFPFPLLDRSESFASPLRRAQIGTWQHRVQSGEGSLWEIVEREMRATPTGALELVGGMLGMPVLHSSDLKEVSFDFDVLPLSDACRERCLLAKQGGEWIGIVTDPFDIALQARIENRLGDNIDWHLAHPADFAACLAAYESRLDSLGFPILGCGAKGGSLLSATTKEEESLTATLVISTINAAVVANASHIHLKTGIHSLVIKYRIDGVLAQVGEIPGSDSAKRFTSRIKAMAGIKCLEQKDIPQEGCFSLFSNGRDVRFHVSLLSSLSGDDIVIRIYDGFQSADNYSGYSLDRLGFDENIQRSIRQLTTEGAGLFLVAGPADSGKTTTLYAAVSEKIDGIHKTVSVEDPIEQKLPGVLQLSVKKNEGFTISKALNVAFQHDPDRVLISDIREAESALQAIQAALSGRIVLSSICANDIADMVGRLEYFGVNLYSFAEAVSGVLVQRLVRKICTNCAVVDIPDHDHLHRLCHTDIVPEAATFLRGKGCRECCGTGYKGRQAVGQMMIFDDDFRELIVSRAPVRQFRKLAHSKGVRLLNESMINLACAGRTSLEEIGRVIRRPAIFAAERNACSEGRH